MVSGNKNVSLENQKESNTLAEAGFDLKRLERNRLDPNKSLADFGIDQKTIDNLQGSKIDPDVLLNIGARNKDLPKAIGEYQAAEKILLNPNSTHQEQVQAVSNISHALAVTGRQVNGIAPGKVQEWSAEDRKAFFKDYNVEKFMDSASINNLTSKANDAVNKLSEKLSFTDHQKQGQKGDSIMNAHLTDLKHAKDVTSANLAVNSIKETLKEFGATENDLARIPNISKNADPKMLQVYQIALGEGLDLIYKGNGKTSDYKVATPEKITAACELIGSKLTLGQASPVETVISKETNPNQKTAYHIPGLQECKSAANEFSAEISAKFKAMLANSGMFGEQAAPVAVNPALTANIKDRTQQNQIG